MAAQQIQIAETIRAMKLALRRHADDSDSDESIHQHTNRGNKLKRKASHVREGKLDNTGGLAYRKKINHAGSVRSTIYTNPTLFDSDGEPFSPTSSDNEDTRPRAVSPLLENPYRDIRLEQLLRPLTNPAELPDHPSLSAPYKSRALTEMAEAAMEMARRERQSLARVKRLLVRLRGDAEWAPLGRFETDNSEVFLDGDSVEDVLPGSAAPSITTGESATGIEGIPQVEIRPATQHGPNGGLVATKSQEKALGEAMDGIETADMERDRGETEQEHKTHPNGKPADDEQPPAESGAAENGSLAKPTVGDIRKSIEPANSENTSVSGNGPTHSMTTRRKARSPTAPSSPRLISPTPSDSASLPTVSSWFLPPPSTVVDRNLNIPPAEAEESRHLLNLYVQKSELVIRHFTQLADGLLKADRMRHDVLQSCKASAHVKDDGKGNFVTSMSDGEDWFDVEEAKMQPWELKDGYLEKGKDEVEEPGEEEARRGGRRRRVGRLN